MLKKVTSIYIINYIKEEIVPIKINIDSDAYYSVQEIAELFGIKVRTVYSWFERHNLKYSTEFGKKRVKGSSLINHIGIKL